MNNAGIGGYNGPVEFLQIKDFQAVLNVNTLGMVDVTTTFLPLVKREKGRIVNITSIAGRFAFSNMAPYAMSKYAAEAFSDSLRFVYYHIIKYHIVKYHIEFFLHFSVLMVFVFVTSNPWHIIPIKLVKVVI